MRTDKAGRHGSWYKDTVGKGVQVFGTMGEGRWLWLWGSLLLAWGPFEALSCPTAFGLKLEVDAINLGPRTLKLARKKKKPHHIDTDTDTHTHIVKTAIYNLCGQRPPGLCDQNSMHRWFCMESPCGEQLPAKCEQRMPGFACTVSITWSMGPQ